VTDKALKAWFCSEVLPLEPVLTRFIRRHLRQQDELADVRQDVYERILAGGARGLPTLTGAYVFTVARNLLINRARRASIVNFEIVSDLEQVVPEADWLTPARHIEGQEELRKVQDGIDLLPPRCREMLILRKIEGMSTREVAERLGVGTDAVEKQITLGMRALIDFMLGGSGQVQRRSRTPRAKSGDVQ